MLIPFFNLLFKVVVCQEQHRFPFVQDAFRMLEVLQDILPENNTLSRLVVRSSGDRGGFVGGPESEYLGVILASHHGGPSTEGWWRGTKVQAVGKK